MSTNTGLNPLGFIKANSLTYTEIQNDLKTFIDALSEDEKLGFKTLFEGTNSQILIEMLAAKMSDEIYHIIASRAENLLYYLNRQDSAIAIAQNCSYSTYRGSNIKLSITMTPNQTATIVKMDRIGIAEDYDLIVTEDLKLTQGQEITFDAYIGTVKEQTLVADTEDLLVFRFTNQNISEQIALYLNGEEVPTTRNILEMTDDKYFCITNAYSGVDAIYLNRRSDFTHRYTNNSELTLKYIEFSDIQMNSINIESDYGIISNVKQIAGTTQPETVSSIRTHAPLYAETQNRIVARDDFHKVLQSNSPEIVDTAGHDYSNAIVEVTYVKKNGELLTDAEYQVAYNDLYNRRAYGIPMCLLEHPDIMLNLNVTVVLQLTQGTSAIIPQYVRQVFSKYELKLGELIDFSQIENDLESYDFVKTARILPRAQTYAPSELVPEGTVFKPSTSNGKLYVVRNPLFLTGSMSPSWSTAVGSTVIDNDIIWTAEDKGYAPQPNWEADKSIRKGNICWVPSIPNVQFRCTGYTYKTSTTEPSWPTISGKYVNDGQIMWMAVSKNITAPKWTASTIIEKGDVVNPTADSSYSYQAINYIPRTPAEEPSWKTNLSLFTDKNIQYAVINEEYDPTKASASNIQLNWNQYVVFNEMIQVV